MDAGYSTRPLQEKLGLKAGMAVCILQEPSEYSKLLGPLPPDVDEVKALSRPLEFIHFFTHSKADLEDQFSELKRFVLSTGMLWISWPKKSAGYPTDLNENAIREIGLAHGMVDVKVCAIDDTWSALKFVFRTKDR